RSSRMRSSLIPLLGLVGVLAWSSLPAQQACTLLTAADIESITGAKIMGEAHPTALEMPSGPQKGQKINGCMWGVGGSGMVSVSAMAMPQTMTREQATAKLEEIYAKLRAKKWTEEDKTYPDGRCTSFTPPPTEQKAPILSGCIVAKNGIVIS